MAVTIQMIETKEFRVTQTGYDPQEVDNFLDEIVDEIERMQKEIKTLRQEAARPRAAAPVQSPQSSEETIRLMLANAQRICDDTMSDAKKRSDDILRQARQEAEQIVSVAQDEDRRLNDQLALMREAVAGYRTKFRKLIDDQMRLFKDDD
ncbi:MAG: DivIVA domain-containing protein [Oscillospiraceae bacterium]|jgi:cell division initiation protein|nr:DivIVA domain-containing protein [Oscillospiraceae bacterium]